jgi:NAD(P) transhydrogenase subunit alpha
MRGNSTPHERAFATFMPAVLQVDVTQAWLCKTVPLRYTSCIGKNCGGSADANSASTVTERIPTMKVGIPKEVLPGETRVAVLPDAVKNFIKKGLTVTVETGAGAAASITDDEYRAAGATIEPRHESVLGDSDMVLKVMRPTAGEAGLPNEVAMLKSGAVFISFMQPYTQRELIGKLAKQGVTTMSMELMPRITRAQAMDALSSMATVAGYKAVLLAANAAPRFFPMFMTAAGTIPAARALIIGAGVAGLQAIATAKRMGASVEAFDVRPAAKEQVLSLGAKFLEMELSKDAEDAGGYAKAQSAEQQRMTLELLAGRMPRVDIVITTAAIPGQRSPMLVTADMVKHMRPGSVIVDLGAEGGGNCELTEPGKVVVKHNVTIIGTLNLPATMPLHASQMYSKNVENLVNHLVGKEGLKLDLADAITAGIVVSHQGQVVHPMFKTA